MNHACGKCPNEWQGVLTCHCSGCHLTFTGVAAFDKHRQRGKCVDPTTIGLVLKSRAYACWGYPDVRNDGQVRWYDTLPDIATTKGLP